MPRPTAPAVQPAARDAHSLGELRIQPAAVTAPALPSAMSLAIAPAPPVEADHPVPPGSIPVVTAVPKEPEPRSRLGELVAQIPLLGSIIEP